MRPLALRVVPPPGTRGPMVICADEEARSYGAVLVPPGSEAFFGVSEAGEYSVRWTGAGGKEHRLSATVEDKPVRVILPGDGR